jgi:hypothetical protein
MDVNDLYRAGLSVASTVVILAKPRHERAIQNEVRKECQRLFKILGVDLIIVVFVLADRFKAEQLVRCWNGTES